MDRRRLADLEERRQAVGVARLAHASEALAGGRLCGGPAGSWLNQAVALGMGVEVTAADVARLIAFYEDHGGNPEVLVCPYADPSLARELGAAGFGLTGFEHVFGLELDGLDLSGEMLPAGVSIRTVDREDVRGVEAWVDASSSGFRPEGSPVPDVLRDGSLRMLADPTMEALVAELDGEVVAGAALEHAGELAALMATSVRPVARRRGIQRALIVERLRRAREEGAVVATIQSEPGIGTERNAERLGFTVQYTRAILRPIR